MPNVFTDKIGPLPTWAWMGIATGGILLVVGIKGKKKGSTDNTAAQQQLAAEEAALANAAGQSSISSNNGASTYGSGSGRYAGTGSGSSGVYSMAPAASSTAPAVSTPSSSPAPAATASTAPAPAKVSAGPISNLQAYSVTSTSAVIKWNPDKNNTQGYAWACTPTSGKGASKKGNTTATSVTVSGLTAKTTYNFGVQGLPGGAGNNIHFTTT